jgi:O-antigen/teichoic acid export membrane protein
VAACIVAAGVLTYGYLALVAHALPTGRYGAFGAYWSIALIIGFGAFLPVELELARLLASRQGRAALPPGALATAAGLAGLSLTAVLAGLPLLLPAVGGFAVAVPLLALCVISGVQFVLRGLLLGTGRLRLHGSLLLLDAALRVAAAAVVAVAWPGAGPAAFAWTLVIAITVVHTGGLAWLVVTRRVHRRDVAPAADARAFPAAVAPLLVGSLCAQVLLNAGPVLVSAAADAGSAALVDRYVATFTLVRLPLFVAVPLQSALVPALTRLSASADPGALRRFLLRLTAGIAALAALGGLLGAAIGPALVRLVFGARYALPGSDTALLASGSGLYLGLLVVSQTLLGARRHRQIALVWLTGLAAGVLVFALVDGLVLRAALFFTVGTAAALLAGLAVLLRPGVAAPSPDPLREGARRAAE